VLLRRLVPASLLVLVATWFMLAVVYGIFGICRCCSSHSQVVVLMMITQHHKTHKSKRLNHGSITRLA
jgi:hypothetical protein